MKVNAYYIYWHGPLLSIDKAREWELSNDDIVCNIYLAHGKKFGKQKASYYCGLAKGRGKKRDRFVTDRLKEPDDPVHNIIDRRPEELWLGEISNLDDNIRSHIDVGQDIELVENLLIYFMNKKVDYDLLLNEKKRDYLKQPVFVINNWCHDSKNTISCDEESLKKIIPAVIVCDNSSDIRYAKTLKTLKE